MGVVRRQSASPGGAINHPQVSSVNGSYEKAPASCRRFFMLQVLLVDAQGLTNTSVTLCSAEFHMTDAPNFSAMNRTGNIVCPGAWI